MLTASAVAPFGKRQMVALRPYQQRMWNLPALVGVEVRARFYLCSPAVAARRRLRADFLSTKLLKLWSCQKTATNA